MLPGLAFSIALVDEQIDGTCEQRLFLIERPASIPTVRNVIAMTSSAAWKAGMPKSSSIVRHAWAKLSHALGDTRSKLLVIESGLLEELIDQFCDLLRRVLMAVVANAL